MPVFMRLSVNTPFSVCMKIRFKSPSRYYREVQKPCKIACSGLFVFQKLKYIYKVEIMQCQLEDSIEWKVDLKSELHMREDFKAYVNINNTTNLLYCVNRYKRGSIHYEKNIY